MGEKPEEYRGPYTCIRCLEPTFNDSDVCDGCEAESLAQLGLDEVGNDITRPAKENEGHG